jgi:hypothetical protein
MALYTERVQTTRRHEYVLPNPVNQAEFMKAISKAYQDYGDTMGQVADDSVWITHADEEIIIYWEEN